MGRLVKDSLHFLYLVDIRFLGMVQFGFLKDEGGFRVLRNLDGEILVALRYPFSEAGNGRVQGP